MSALNNFQKAVFVLPNLLEGNFTILIVHEKWTYGLHYMYIMLFLGTVAELIFYLGATFFFINFCLTRIRKISVTSYVDSLLVKFPLRLAVLTLTYWNVFRFIWRTCTYYSIPSKIARTNFIVKVFGHSFRLQGTLGIKFMDVMMVNMADNLHELKTNFILDPQS